MGNEKHIEYTKEQEGNFTRDQSPQEKIAMRFADLPFANILAVTTMTLATTGADDIPHAAPVYFVAGENLHLYFFSENESLHCQHVSQNPRVAAAIYPECEGWRDIKGLQLHGEARLVESPEEWEQAWERYQRKFPFVASLKSVVAKNQMYVFVPSWIRLVDNSQGFGFKKEWQLS
jgi:uncharacterized protein YhbP (UPF0306 family)